jgi:hypothetical protein
MVASTFPPHGAIKVKMHRAYMTSVRQMSRAIGLPLAIDQLAHHRGRDFLFAPTPPNLRLMSEGEKDGYR